jgi:hypothetical protein
MTDDGEKITAEGEHVIGQSNPDLGAEISQLQERYQRLAEVNQREMMALAQMGAAVDPSSLNRMRLDMFISFIFARLGNTSDEVRQLLTLQFEVEYEDTVSTQLKNVKGEVRKAMMGLGAQVSEEQIKEMWRRQQGGNGGPGPGGLITP